MTSQHGRIRTALRTLFRCLVCGGLLLVGACAAERPKEVQTTFYPPLPELPRLQYLTTINGEDDLSESDNRFREFLLGTTKSRRVLRRPFDVAHEKGKIYVLDTRWRTVIVIDLKERKFEAITDIKGGPLQTPLSVFVTPDGSKFVADRTRNQVVVYNRRNEFQRTYGTEGQFTPVDVVVAGDRVYVADVRDSEIEVLDRDTGEVIMTIGEQGPEEGQFHWPTHLTLDSDGNLYVTDFLNFRVQKFDRNGKFIKAVGELGDFPGAMPRPKGIAVDKEGYLYVVDVAFELVQIFDQTKPQVLLGFGKFGGGGGTWLPAGIDIDYDNVEYFARYVDPNFRAKYLVYVVNQAGPLKLNVYAFGDWIGPKPAGARTSNAPES